MMNVSLGGVTPDVVVEPATISEGGVAVVRIHGVSDLQKGDLGVDSGTLTYTVDENGFVVAGDDGVIVARWDTTGLRPSVYSASVKVGGEVHRDQLIVTPRPLSREDILPVSMRRAGVDPTPDQILWTIIRNRTNAIGFDRFDAYMNQVMLGEVKFDKAQILSRTPFTDTVAYNVLKIATEQFIMHEVGVIDPEAVEAELNPDPHDPGVGPPELEHARVTLQEESRRRGRALSAGDLTRLREDYYEELVNGTASSTNLVLPYLGLIRRKLGDLQIKNRDEVASGLSYGISYSRVTGPLAIEYIWSYWIEESGLVQALNAVVARFQNRATPGHQQLARLDLDPLRPLSNLIWGYVQDEQHRLSLVRRAYEYAHQYGLTLEGKAVPKLDVADNRARFLSSFHNLLNRCAHFYLQDDDTTVIADGFPVLNALREVHMVLAEGAHNQFGDLPSTARVEMLMQQWLLARPEMREYLGGRIMVPYAEPWMDRVDTIRSMLGFGPASVSHFRDLAVYGEQILLPIRYGNWSRVNDAASAANWARYWRPEVQRYVHAYQAVTGVDLTAGTDARRPSRLLQERAGASR